MIFVTIGTTHFPFQRMVSFVFGHLTHMFSQEKILFQYGDSKIPHVVPENIEAVRYMSFDDVQKAIQRARIVISHGGPATIFQILGAGKKPYVLPREKRYKEHVDNHQLLFCLQLEEEGIIVNVTEQSPKNELHKKRNKYTADRKQLVDYFIIHY